MRGVKDLVIFYSSEQLISFHVHVGELDAAGLLGFGWAFTSNDAVLLISPVGLHLRLSVQLLQRLVVRLGDEEGE